MTELVHHMVTLDIRSSDGKVMASIPINDELIGNENIELLRHLIKESLKSIECNNTELREWNR